MLIHEKYPKPNARRPEAVLQIGEGNFLRAFVDWMVELSNRGGQFDGSVVLCQPIAQGMAEQLNAQDCTYTVVMRGMENNVPVERTEVIRCCSRAINPYADYDAFLAIARSTDLKVIVSNTTEAGIAYGAGDRLTDRPPASYPAKLTAFLYERFRHFDGAPEAGVLVLPVELIDDNGHELKRLIHRYAAEWDLPDGFLRWVDGDCEIASTLVDRIVTGYPQGEIARFREQLGYDDNCLVTCELFNLWVIEGDAKWADVFPVHETGANVIWTDDVTPYKKRKVRILNGAHTATVLAAYLAGHDIVLELMDDPVFSGFMRGLLLNEVIPTLDLPRQDLTDFAEAVEARFRNPYIKHKLLDISLNSCAKFRARCLPSLLEYVQKERQLPGRLAFSLAALIRFYKGECTDEGYMGTRENGDTYPIRDDAQVLAHMNEAWSAGDARQVARLVLANEALWGEDLTGIPDLLDAVAHHLTVIEREGVAACMRSL